MFKTSRATPSPSRIFAIGDVHGCAQELEALLRKLYLRSDDLVVFLGDFVDRGPDSRRVIDLVLDLRKHCQVVALKGNHEAMFLDFLERPESVGAGLFILNGGSATLASYSGPGGSFEMPEEHIRFLQELSLAYETDKYYFVHAGLPDVPLSELDPQEHEKLMLWIRDPFLKSKFNWGKVVIHGHTPVVEPERKPNRINVDTGCVYDGYLTAVELPAMKFHRVEKGIKHEPPLYPRVLFNDHRVAVRFAGRLPVKAARAGEKPMDFETLNFNQFGLLIRDARTNSTPVLQVDDQIEGRIGEKGEDAIQFSGRVVRIEHRGEFACYGVQIDQISNGSGGREWVKRPTE